MGQITTRVRAGGQDASDAFTPPATHVWDAGAATSPFWTNGPTKHTAYMQFRPDLAPAAVVSGASLSLKAVADWSGTKGTHKVALLDRFSTPLDATVVSDAVLAAANFPGELWTAGSRYEYPITSLVQAALAHGSYAAGKYLTLAIESDETTQRLMRAVDGEFLDGPELRIDFEAAADTEMTPYEKVLRGLWWLLEANPEFGRLVPAGNRVNWLGPNRSPQKGEAMTADFPEVRILGTKSRPQYDASSSSSFSVETFEVQVRTGDKRINHLWYPVKLAIVRALRPWHECLMSLRWRGRQFVHLLRPLEMTEGLNVSLANTRNEEQAVIEGWASVWGCEVSMNFRTIDL